MNFITFKVDSPYHFNSIMIASSDGDVKDARSDAIQLMQIMHGRHSAVRVSQESGSAYGPDPVCDKPIKNATSNGEHYAWLCFNS